ncbi:carbamoyltransferase family protein [Ferruginibacter sp.]|nr:carbamoyltransferase [Ferruginibacter sp.]
MIILGISAYYHDAAAAIIKDGVIIAAAQEERFTRIKHDESFPVNAIAFCLKEAAIEIDDLDVVVFYDKPFLKFERILETYIAYAPKGFLSFLKAIPIWIKDKLFLKKKIKDELDKLCVYDKRKLKLLFTDHHLSHAASAYYPSSFTDAAVLTIDGVGEWTTTSIYKAEDNTLIALKEMHFPHSVGLLYSAFTYFLGFKVNSGEYKLMGLAPYGNAGNEQTEHYKKIIKEKLCTIYDDGSIFLEQKYFSYGSGFKMISDSKWQQLFGMAKRQPDDSIEQQHSNLALAIQQVTEEIVIKLAIHAKAITGSNNLCLAGGVALNCVANGRLQELNIFDKIYIQPAAGDAGGALGAALAAHHIYFDRPKNATIEYDTMQGSYVGPSFTNEQIIYACKKNKLQYEVQEDEALNKNIAAQLANGKVVGWFKGKMEFGPRALGNRSILADPRNAEMQQKLNLKIKFREGFRPFAPAVLAEQVSTIFKTDQPSPYMLMVTQVKDQNILPADYATFSLAQKLQFAKSNLPAITHADGSARIQTVHKNTNAHFWNLINEFYQRTNCPLLVNTSFNVRGEPIVCTPEEAIDCFLNTGMDILVMENIVLEKEKQTIVMPATKRVFKED